MNLDKLLAQVNAQIIFISHLKGNCTPSQEMYFDQALVKAISLAHWLEDAKAEENVQ